MGNYVLAPEVSILGHNIVYAEALLLAVLFLASIIAAMVYCVPVPKRTKEKMA